jgi:hypothetical protein
VKVRVVGGAGVGVGSDWSGISSKEVDYLESEVFKALQFQFSSGVRLRELVSIASVVASLCGCSVPTKKEKRSFDV